MTINIASEFSRHPAGRVEKDGPNNGARFRDELLIPILKEAIEKKTIHKVVVDIDGCRSFGSSFLEEAFGGLARVTAFPFMEAMKVLKIKATKPHLQIYKDAIIEYLEDAKNSWDINSN